MSVSKAFMNAFDRMGSQGSQLTLIEEHTRGTKESVAVGGALYEKLNELTTAIVDIKEGGKGGVKGALGGAANALAIAVVAPAMEPVAKGFQLLVDAINALEGTGDETKAKMEGLVSGLVLLGDVGKSILAFAGYMFLATPLLMVVGLMSPLIGIALFATVMSVQLATKLLDEKKLEKVKMLKDVGLGILAFTASLALSSLIIKPAIIGALGASVALGIMALIFNFIPDKALDNMVKAKDVLIKVGLGILTVMGALAISALIGPLALKGAFFAGIAILAIGGAFYLLERMQIMDKIEDGAKGLLLAAGAILGLGIALALFNIITPPLPVLFSVFAVVAGVGIAFALVGVTINRGLLAGVAAGQPVISADGLVGQVVVAYPHAADVLMMTDATHHLPVQVTRTRERAIAVGVGRMDRVELRNLPDTVDIIPGDLLETSGLGERFQPGIPVAQVKEVIRAPGQPFARVIAEPLAPLARLSLVMVDLSEDES